MDGEPAAHAGFLEVNLQAVQEADALLIYNYLKPFDVQVDILFALLIIETHAIGEAAAATGIYSDS
ncbi:hypothetical protein D3C80_2120740 [compost metagenome]